MARLYRNFRTRTELGYKLEAPDRRQTERIISDEEVNDHVKGVYYNRDISSEMGLKIENKIEFAEANPELVIEEPKPEQRIENKGEFDSRELK